MLFLPAYAAFSLVPVMGEWYNICAMETNLVNNTAKPKKFDWKYELGTIVIIVVLVALQAVVINGMYKPNGLVSGGFTGTAMLFEYAFGLPMGITVFVLNIPVLLLALWKLHLRFTIYTIFSTLWFSFCATLTANVQIPFDFTDPVSRITSALLGAVIVGATGAPIVRRGASGGGTDILALLLSKRYSFQMGTLNLAFNLIVIAALAFIKGLDVAALSIVVMFVSSVAFNNAMQGLNRTKTLFIISDRWEEIAPDVLSQVHRGVTLIPAKGAYTGNDKTLVYVIARTTELASIRRIVREKDPKAMLSIIDTREVLGRGFDSIQ